MKRYVYAFDSPESAKAAVSLLADIGIGENRISIAAAPGLQLDEIPARFLDASMDFGPAIGRGVGIGGATGLFAGLVMMSIPPLGIAIGGASLLAFLSGGALIGAWSGAIIGSAVPDSVHRKFDDEIEAGRTLVVIDSDGTNDASIVAMMAERADRHLVWQSTL